MLVVDDSATIRELLNITLGRLGIAVDFAASGTEAIHLANQEVYDLAFLDITLPDIDGYRVCKRLKGEAKTKNMPVIMLTSRNTTFDRVRGMMAGTDVYLTKPLDRVSLIAAMSKYLPQYVPETGAMDGSY